MLVKEFFILYSSSMHEIAINRLKEQFQEAIQALVKKFSGLRTGRANPALLEPLTVEAYGGRMPLSQVATVSAPEARLLTVNVWDNSVVSAVDKAIQAFGLMPIVEGMVLRVPLPELSQERRQDLIKTAKSYAEDAKIGGRNLRRSALDTIEKNDLPEDVLHGVKKDIQKMIDDFISQIDKILVDKEKDILKV